MTYKHQLPIVIYSENNVDYVIYGATSAVNSGLEAVVIYPITKITFHDANHTTVSTSGLLLETIKSYETNNNVTVNIKFDRVIVLGLIQNNCVFDD